MSPFPATASVTAFPSVEAVPAEAENAPWRRALSLWLRFFFWGAERAPGLVRAARPFWVEAAWQGSAALREATLANARRLLGPDATPRARAALAKAVVANFYRFIAEVGRAPRLTKRDLLARIEEVRGREAYQAARRAKRGAILVTAHLGAFEIGIAALAEHEPRIHVVFRPDPFAAFERLRSMMRNRLGVVEAPVDGRWPVWRRLRDALAADEVVLLQGDRVMPGQRGVPVPFLDGHLLMPTGPVKLALLSGAPVVPVFALRTPSGRVRIVIEDPITVEPDAGSPGRPHPALGRMAAVIERHVRAHPDQWLMLQRAWCEDREGDLP